MQVVSNFHTLVVKIVTTFSRSLFYGREVKACVEKLALFSRFLIPYSFKFRPPLNLGPFNFGTPYTNTSYSFVSPFSHFSEGFTKKFTPFEFWYTQNGRTFDIGPFNYRPPPTPCQNLRGTKI